MVSTSFPCSCRGNFSNREFPFHPFALPLSSLEQQVLSEEKKLEEPAAAGVGAALTKGAVIRNLST